MAEIRLGLEDGISITYVTIYASYTFSWLQMRELRLSLEDGLMATQVSDIANKRLPASRMAQVRWGITRGIIPPKSGTISPRSRWMALVSEIYSREQEMIAVRSSMSA